MASAEARVEAVIAPAVAAAELVLEKVVVTPAGKRKLVRVTVDLPETETGALDLDRVAEVSRLISEAMDAAEPLGQSPYVLEVSSPGVSRPLIERRHWSRARSRLVATTVGGVPFVGRVLEVGDDGVTFALETEGDEGLRTAGWDELGTGKVQLEFSRAEDDADEAADEIDVDEADDETDEELN